MNDKDEIMHTKFLQKTVILSAFSYILLVPLSVFANGNLLPHKGEQDDRAATDSLEKSTIDSIIDYAETLQKSPHYKGIAGPNSFNRSGFIRHVFSHFGYNIPETADEQSTAFYRLKKNQITKGDLVFFEGRRQNGQIAYVGIVVDAKGEIGDFDFIHASAKSGIIISNSQEPYYKKRFLKAVRVIVAGRGVAVGAVVADGNVDTINSNHQQIIPSVQVTEYVSPAKYHQVRSGETLSLIAKRYEITVDELKRKNKLSTSVIVPDQLLKIVDEEKRREIVHLENFSPNDLFRDTIYIRAIEKGDNPLKKVETTPAPDDAEGQTIPASETSELKHKVQKGESLYMISLQYGVSIGDIEKYNKLESHDIEEGMILKIPNPSE
ncbi:MAG: LysM peptidoglycan-binding domain-containing protein [Prevotellaceae bacterium]|jgi:LysM repeat protein/cell wall-associated NlpC family hydrolase|nr:LysM peptidoglycan-binding domain-containing protein [Prevotellaceae bacterium]